MGDDRYDDSAALCQYRLLVDRMLSSAVPILLPVIDKNLFATQPACLGSSKGMVSPRIVPEMSDSTIWSPLSACVLRCLYHVLEAAKL